MKKKLISPQSKKSNLTKDLDPPNSKHDSNKQYAKSPSEKLFGDENNQYILSIQGVHNVVQRENQQHDISQILLPSKILSNNQIVDPLKDNLLSKDKQILL